MKGFWGKLKTLFITPHAETEETVIPVPKEGDEIAKNTAGASYHNDKPIESIEHDRFSRWPFARRVAETLAIRTDSSSVVVGIYGPWGDGKTSVLRLMEVALQEYPNAVPVRFNPWYFGSQEQLLQGFFKTVAQEAGKSLIHNKEKLGELLEKYGSLLSLASLSLGGGIVSIGSGGDAAVGLGKALSTVELDDLKERLEKILEESGKRIIVMIDDIDRLDHDEIHAIFKLVKLSAGFNHISYVLALDDTMVAGALGKRFGDGDSQAGRNFLEKIIQVPLHLPAADDIELRKVAFEGVDMALKQSGIELTQEQADTFVRHFVDGLEQRLLTPRQAKLYANALAFALPILKGEVHTVDHMLIEGIRIFYPKLYFVIKNNPSFFLEEERRRSPHQDEETKRIIGFIDDAIRASGEENVDRVKERLLKPLFPRAIGNVHYDSDWDQIWAKEQRVSSAEYFSRYFQYSVPTGDISDLATGAFLKDFDKKDDAEIDTTLKSFSGRNGIAALVKKLRAQETTIDPVIVPKLALAFARSGALVPREKQLFSDWSLSQAAILISHLTKRLSTEKEREDLAKKVIQSAEPLAFAFECFRWFRIGDEDKEAERIVSKETEKELGQLLAERVKKMAAEAPLYKTNGSDTPRLFWVWNEYGDHKEVEEYLKKLFDANTSDVYDFLDTYVGTSWGIESGLSQRSEFSRENYDAVAKLIQPNLIYQKLMIQFSAELQNPQFYLPRDTSVQRQLAHQFAVCHHKAISEANAKVSRPRIDVDGNFTVTGGPDGNYIDITLVNTSDKPAVDVEVKLEADEADAQTLVGVQPLLTPAQKSPTFQVRYDHTPFFEKKLTNPKVMMRYKDQEGNSYTSGRFIQQDARADSNQNINTKPLDYFEN